MYPERSLLSEELNAFIRIAMKEPCVLIVAKDVLIGQTMVKQFAAFPSVDSHRVGQFVQPLE